MVVVVIVVVAVVVVVVVVRRLGPGEYAAVVHGAPATPRLSDLASAPYLVQEENWDEDGCFEPARIYRTAEG